MKFITNPCPLCGKTSTVEIEQDKMDRWRQGEYVQNVFPEWTADERELLITGTHPKCWDEMFEQDEPEPDTCIECGELAVGVDESGTLYCSQHYRRR